MSESSFFYATGKRKSAIAKVWLKKGNGKITVNNKDFKEYFPVISARYLVKYPLILTKNLDNFDVNIKVLGGGIKGQADASKHGIAKALLHFNEEELKKILKKAGLLKRDARIKERKKYGQKGARARFQFSKR